MNSTLTRTDYRHYFEEGMTSTGYMDIFERKVAGEVPDDKPQYLPLNLQRSRRILKTFQLKPEIESFLSTLHHPIYWLAISEHWCGDSAQIIPALSKVAEASNGKVNLRLVYRDQFPALIDQHLTIGMNGQPGKAIPKLIQLDTDFRVTGVWGPRPNEAQQLVRRLKSNPETADRYSEELHKWYAQDKTQSTQRDLLKLLRLGAAMCPECRAH